MGWRHKIYGKFSKILTIILIFSIFLETRCQISCDKISNLTAFKLKMEEKVIKINNALIQQFRNVCNDQIKNCYLKSYDLCQGTPQRMCLSNFPTLPHCLFKPGMWISNSSGVRISNVMQKNNLTHNARKFICASALIQPIFQQMVANNHNQYSFAYVGSSSGAVRVSPAFKQGMNMTTNQCQNYDPRKRPWYVSAITGSKTTIILLDISRTMTSMHPGVRFTNSKVALQIIFGTLNNFDYVGVVVFSKSARTLVFDKVVRATGQNKQRILWQIQNLQVNNSGSTNYTASLQSGLKMLKGVQTLCGDTAQTVFLLLTDGYTENDQPENAAFLQSYLDTQFKNLGKSPQNLKLISFVFGVQSNINYTLVQQLTCLYEGIVFRIWDGIDQFGMVEKLTSYYIFLSEGINKDLIKPVWSEFYEDAFGFGTIVTVTMPIYVEGRVNKIIGVVGIDILVQQFVKCGFSTSFVDQSFRNQPQCFKSNLNPNQLLYLQCQQGNIPCSSKNLNQTCSQDVSLTTEEVCSQNIIYDIFYPTPIDPTEDQDKCCAISIHHFLMIILPILGALIICFVIFVLYKRGIFQKIIKCFRKKQKDVSIKQENEDVAISLLGDKNLITDPLKKYKLAEENNVKIYRQPQFCL